MDGGDEVPNMDRPRVDRTPRGRDGDSPNDGTVPEAGVSVPAVPSAAEHHHVGAPGVSRQDPTQREQGELTVHLNCPWCGAPLELVTDGWVGERQVPFFSCGRCEYCAEVIL